MLWPALAAASASEVTALITKQLVDLALGADRRQAGSEPTWATPNAIALELNTVRLRDFSARRNGSPVLLCAPFALHGAAVSDFAPGHSLVEALRDAGVERLFVTDWRPASADMRFLGIDDYLACLNVLVDYLGGNVDLVGLCQGGWMSMLYAARFPTKIRKLVVAGAPIDLAAARSGLSALADATPTALFHELVKLGDGRVRGRMVAKYWGPETVESGELHQLLETSAPLGSPAFARLDALFRTWHAWTVDLPGTYFLEVVERLYRRNELAAGSFPALGQKIDLASMRTPLLLLAARDDELVAPAQLFAAEHLVGTPADKIRTALAPCRHLGLFMGKTILTKYWPSIARWLIETEPCRAAS